MLKRISVLRYTKSLLKVLKLGECPWYSGACAGFALTPETPAMSYARRVNSATISSSKPVIPNLTRSGLNEICANLCSKENGRPPTGLLG